MKIFLPTRLVLWYTSFVTFNGTIEIVQVGVEKRCIVGWSLSLSLSLSLSVSAPCPVSSFVFYRGRYLAENRLPSFLPSFLAPPARRRRGWLYGTVHGPFSFLFYSHYYTASLLPSLPPSLPPRHAASAATRQPTALPSLLEYARGIVSASYSVHILPIEWELVTPIQDMRQNRML